MEIYDYQFFSWASIGSLLGYLAFDNGMFAIIGTVAVVLLLFSGIEAIKTVV